MARWLDIPRIRPGCPGFLGGSSGSGFFAEMAPQRKDPPTQRNCPGFFFGGVRPGAAAWKSGTRPTHDYDDAFASDEGYKNITYRVMIGTSSARCKIDGCRSAEDIVNKEEGK